jgi:hypothetical protein
MVSSVNSTQEIKESMNYKLCQKKLIKVKHEVLTKQEQNNNKQEQNTQRTVE